MPDLRALEQTFHPNSTNEGDGISALILAVEMIRTHCKKLKYTKSIVLVTNGTGTFNTEDGMEAVTDEIKAQNINLTVLGVDFDDEEFGVKEDDKREEKRVNERELMRLVEMVDGAYGTLAEAVAELGRPRLKSVRPVASYRGKLTLGDVKDFKDTFAIDVERYPRTMVAKPASASRYTVAEKEGGEVKLEEVGEGQMLEAVRQARQYQVDKEGAEGEKMEIDKEDMEKGYKYGRTVVPISSTDEAVTVLETEQGMEIVGFIQAEKVCSCALRRREELIVVV